MPRRTIRPRHVAALAVVVALAFHYAHALFGLARAGQYDFVDVWLMDGLFFAAAGIALAAGWKRQRRAAIVLAAGIGSYGLGYVWYHAFMRGGATGFPTVSDVLWLAFYPCAAAAVLLPARRYIPRPSGAWLDAAVIGFALFALGWVFVIDPALAASPAGTENVTLSATAYLLGDLAVIALLAGVATAQLRVSRAKAVFAGGLLTLAAADIGYAYAVSEGLDVTGSVLDPLWVTGMLVAGLSVRYAHEESSPAKADSPVAIAVPLAAAMVTLVVVLIAGASTVPKVLLLVTAALICVRLAGTLSINRNLLAAVRRTERRYRELVESSQDAIWSIDDQARVSFINAAGERLFGYSRVDMIGTPFASLLAPSRREADLDAFGQVLGGTPLSNYQTTIVTRDGDERVVLVNAAPRTAPDGRLLGTTGTATDITERVRAEHEREDIARRLQESERLESVGRLAGGIAHDFNNLLAVILNYADFTSAAVDDRPDVREDVAEIRRAAARAADLTHQLLLFSKRERVVAQVVDLNDVVRAMEKMLARTIGEDIDLTTDLADGLPETLGDPTQVEQIVLNLVLNAREAMPDGGALTLRTEGVVDGEREHWVRLVVSDSGIGMTAEVRDHAFEPFFTTKRASGGTGLGLATVYGIVTQSGGSVEIASEPGAGTTVQVDLPVAERDGVAAAPAVEPGADPADGSGQRILVVEDEPGLRRVAGRILSNAGYQVVEADSGTNALEQHGDDLGEIDALLTDLVMPGISGKDLARHCRGVRPGMPTVYMSGYSHDVVDGREPLEEGVAFVSKPFSAEALLGALDEVLAGHAAGPAEPALD